MFSLPSLSAIVTQTIQGYKKIDALPAVDTSVFRMPLVVWSGNGFYTGRILFRWSPAFFASESEVEEKLAKIPAIEEVIVISASGEKHAPLILQAAKDHGKRTYLISSAKESTGKNIADSSYIFPKFREPYTYNTSTYFGYMYGLTDRCDLGQLEVFIETILNPLLIEIEWNAYSGFCIVLPNEFVLLREMLEVKFIELFGRKLSRDVFSYEWMRHATTVVQDDRELFICFWNNANVQYGKNQINLPVFDRESYAAMMMVGYYVVGKIQESFPSYFADSIEDYCTKAKDQSGFYISPWVEA